MNNMLDKLNERQKEAVLATEGPVLVLAGAGSGKTTVLVNRIAYMISEKHIRPWNILAITFTNKAAREMKDRIERLLGDTAKDMWIGTFHSVCVRILRSCIDLLGYSRDFVIYDTADTKTVMKECLRELDIDEKSFPVRNVLSIISNAKNDLMDAATFENVYKSDYRMSIIAKIYYRYQTKLRKNNAVDFDDIILNTVKILSENPDVLSKYQDKFRYILVDEYQDTNNSQYLLINLLAQANRNLCVVGDDDQSIYKFRGANIGNILGFEKIFPRARVIKLEQNYRSTKTILEAANQVIHNNIGRKAKTLWTDNEIGEPVHYRQFMNGYEEAEYIAGDISKRVREGECEYKDCAILYRTNAQSRMFEEKFLMANIPYRLVGGVNFYARKEIKDLLAYLKTVDNARDDLAVRRIINVPKRGIGAASLSKVQDFADQNGIGFYDALQRADEITTLGRAVSKITPFVTFIQSLRSKLDYISPSELLKDIIDETGYVTELQAEKTEEAESRIENIDELITKVVSYEEECEANNEEISLSGFLEEVALIADIDTVDGDDNRVLLMTLHSAKGLEFPYVYLAGMEDGVFPSYMTIVSDDPTEIEEERRLCYVGITRAMKDLTLTCAQQRMIRGETQYNKPSRFIREIPKELVDLGKNFKERKVKEIPLPKGYQQMKKAIKEPAFMQKKFEVKKASSLSYDVGDTVKHIKFGTGVVKSIVDGGRDYEVTVDFEKAGVKKMFASFAKLKKL